MNESIAELTVADYIAEFLAQISCNKVHGLMGGGAAGLNDAFIRNSHIEYYCYHHEQSAGYAAVGESRLSRRWAILNPTTGCGGTNCFTPVLNAWQDSLPLIVISGNVNLNTCSSHLNERYGISLRAYGVQEHDVIKSMRAITKYCALLERPENIQTLMYEAFVSAGTGRKGPCWIDIPADLQHTAISDRLILEIPNQIKLIYSAIESSVNRLPDQKDLGAIEEIISIFRASERALILVGGGVSNNVTERGVVNNFIVENNLPVIATYAGTDIVDHEYDMYLGTIGVKGNRAANFALQNCDALLVLGSRLAFGAVGYDVDNFARHAAICVAEIDFNEIKKNENIFPNRIKQALVKASTLVEYLRDSQPSLSKKWLASCKSSKKNWGIITENIANFDNQNISIYQVMEELNRPNYDHCNFVTDAGSVSYVAPTSLKYSESRNFIFSPAQADMGCALPSALGVAASSDQRTICIVGDGSFMSNSQELGALAFHNYNLTIIILNNSGYLSISNTQRNNYGRDRVYGEHSGRGIIFPDFEKLCSAFGLKYKKVNSLDDLKFFRDCGTRVIEVLCSQSETIAPYQAKVNNAQAGAHDMAPFKELDELNRYATVDLKFVRE